MSKGQNDSMLDAALNYVADNGTQMDVVSDISTPTDLSGSLATRSLSAGDGNGDYIVQDGEISGRRLTISQQSDITVDADGDANHIVISDGVTLYLVTTCTTQTLTSGNTVTVPSFDDEIADAS